MVKSRRNFHFSILADVTRESYIDGNGIRRVTFTDIDIYQGNLLNLNYSVDTSTKQSFIIPSADADVDLLTVIVDHFDTSVPLSYRPVKDITEISATDRVYLYRKIRVNSLRLYLETEYSDVKYKMVIILLLSTLILTKH